MNIRKRYAFAAVGVLGLSAALLTPAMAATPEVPADQAMYAADVTYGDPVPVNMDPANADHWMRLDPRNVLGPFDASQSQGGAANDYFFSLAARTATTYTFGEKFCNVSAWPTTPSSWANTDIQFAEVTWGSGASWHPEAAQVFLTGAVVDGVPQTDPYYVGVVWNRIGVQYVTAANRLATAQSYSPDPARELATSVVQTDGVQQLIGFNLPANVQSAVGVKLVDVTADVYDLPTTTAGGSLAATYLDVAGTGALFTVAGDPAVQTDITVTSGTNGNTDGYDLDAIRVYKCAPELGTKTATGMGERILKKGTWFMYNTYTDSNLSTPGNDLTFDIQLNNPAVYPNNTIGTYTVEDMGGGMYNVTYALDPDYTTTIGGWVYEVEVVATHLGISNSMTFTANPAIDDNQDFGEPFSDSDGTFNVFAHFVVGFK